MNPDPGAAEVLAVARGHRADRDAAEVGLLEAAIAWAGLHVASEDEPHLRWRGTPVAMTGEGAPLVQEFCVAEFAAALGLRTGAGREFLADAVELAHRLPGVLAGVREGRVAVFKARRIAQRTNDLSLAGAEFVDRRVAFVAGRISLAAVERLVEEARARFEPEEAAELARQAAEVRTVVVNTRQVSFFGTMSVFAELDLADAMDLEESVGLLAGRLGAEFPELSVGACRARALGMLARGELRLIPDPRGRDETAGMEPVVVGKAKERVLNLNLHLNAGSGETFDAAVFCENGKRLVALDQVVQWCGEATRVVVRPVIDLHEEVSVSGYAIPDRVQVPVKLRDRYCRFAFCEHQATHCDTDHQRPFDPHGPPGQTATSKLASLCRHHHRLKTHAGWSYRIIEPGTYLWTSPYGYRYLVDATGTRELTPLPVEAPRTA